MVVLAKREPTTSNAPPTRSKLRRKNLKKISEIILTPNNAKTTANHPPTTEVVDLAVEDVEVTANQVPIAVINAVVLIAESVHPKLVRVLTSVATAEKIQLRTSRIVAMAERMIKIKIDFLVQIIW